MDYKEELKRLMEEAAEAENQAIIYLLARDKVVDLNEWVTIREYCKRFGIKSTETVSNWIKRGIIPAKDTIVIKELNDIRLVRARAYHVRAYKNA